MNLATLIPIPPPPHLSAALLTKCRKLKSGRLKGGLSVCTSGWLATYPEKHWDAAAVFFSARYLGRGRRWWFMSRACTKAIQLVKLLKETVSKQLELHSH